MERYYLKRSSMVLILLAAGCRPMSPPSDTSGSMPDGAKSTSTSMPIFPATPEDMPPTPAGKSARSCWPTNEKGELVAGRGGMGDELEPVEVSAADIVGSSFEILNPDGTRWIAPSGQVTFHSGQAVLDTLRQAALDAPEGTFEPHTVCAYEDD